MYQASSPDEEALVIGAKGQGVEDKFYPPLPPLCLGKHCTCQSCQSALCFGVSCGGCYFTAPENHGTQKSLVALTVGRKVRPLKIRIVFKISFLRTVIAVSVWPIVVKGRRLEAVL